MGHQDAWRYGGHWTTDTASGFFASTSELPNVAGSSFQRADVKAGDLAWVEGVGLYKCSDGTLGAAVWVLSSEPFIPSPNGEGWTIPDELQVGTPEAPAEFAAGGGDSYDADVLIYTETALNVFTDVSDLNGTGPITFPGVATDNAIYISSDKQDSALVDYLRFPGAKLDVSIAAVLGGGAFVSEYWDGAAWTETPMLVTKADAPYYTYADQLFERAQSEQLRLQQGFVNSGWTKNDPPGTGTDRYWLRFRISSTITTAPTLTRIKLHTNRIEINADGFMEYFGAARVQLDFAWDLGMLAPAASTPSAQDVYLSDTLDIGRNFNTFRNVAVDRISFVTKVPPNMCTSCPVVFSWGGFTDNNSAGNIDWVVRWAPLRVGDGVFPTAAAAPTLAVEQQEVITVVAAPVALNTFGAWSAVLDCSNFNVHPATGFPDGLWISLERDGTGDSHTGDVSLVNVAGTYVTWCAGGYIGA